MTVAACGSSTSGGGTQASAPASAAATTTAATPAAPASAATTAAATSTTAAASTAATATSSATATDSAASTGAAACKDGQLTLASAKGSGAGGSFYGSADYTLVGSTPCTVTGYGGLDVYTSQGVQHASRSKDAVQNVNTVPMGSVTVTASSGAEVDFRWSENPSGTSTSCPSITKLVLTAPGLHNSTTEPYSALGFMTSLCSAPTIGYAIVPVAH